MDINAELELINGLYELYGKDGKYPNGEGADIIWQFEKDLMKCFPKET